MKNKFVFQGIATNEVYFEAVKCKDIPQILKDKIELHKNKEGFTLYYNEQDDHLYIAIMAGCKSMADYKIEVTNVDDVEGRLHVFTTEMIPKYEANLSKIIAYPYTVIKLQVTTFEVHVKKASNENYSYFE